MTAAWAIFLVLFLAIVFAFIMYRAETQARLQLLFDHRRQEIVDAANDRLDGYGLLLAAGRGLFAASKSVEAAEWQRHYNSLNIAKIFPEVLLVGYAERQGEDIVSRYQTAGSSDEIGRFDSITMPASAGAFIRAAQLDAPVLVLADGPLAAHWKKSGYPGQAVFMVLSLGGADGKDRGYVYLAADINGLFEHVLSTLSWRDVRLEILNTHGRTLYDSLPSGNPETGLLVKNWTAEEPLELRHLPVVMRVSSLEFFGHRLGQIEYIWAMIAAGLCVFAVFTAFLLLSLKKAQSTALSRDLDLSRDDAREREALLKVFFKNAPVALAMFDKDVNYIAYSDKWLHDSGLGDVDLIGRSHYEVFPDYLKDNPDARITGQRVMNGETVIKDKMRVTRADGGWDYIRYEARPWRNLKGEVAGVISFRETITGRLKTEDELRRYAREVEQFAYIASHDLKAPLRGIDNLAKWIAEDMESVMTPEVRESFVLLRSRVVRLETLLDDILRYSRAGHVVEEARSIDTFELISTITKLNPWGENFEIKCEGLMPVLMSARTPLEQIFTNLITNAIKHHDRKSGHVTIKALPFRNHVEFIVQDDGPGIPPEFHERVFGLFQTLKPRDQVEGSGLGMSIIKKLIEWQDGRVWVESDGKRGTAIHFEWPRTPVERKEKNGG